MGGLYNFAKRELDLLLEFSTPDDRPIVEPFIPQILALIKKFGNTGQSGGSAPLTIEVLTTTIHELLCYRPLQPLTGVDSEWMEVTYPEQEAGAPVIFQNVRNPAVFKEGAQGVPYFLDAIVWRSLRAHSNGSAFTSEGIEYQSRQYFRMPFTPMTFYVDVNVTADEDGEHRYIRFEEQMEDVFRYYIRPDQIDMTVGDDQ